MACAYKCRPPSLHALFCQLVAQLVEALLEDAGEQAGIHHRHRSQGIVDVLAGMTPEEREAAVSDHYIEVKRDYGSIGSLCA